MASSKSNITKKDSEHVISKNNARAASMPPFIWIKKSLVTDGNILHFKMLLLTYFKIFLALSRHMNTLLLWESNFSLKHHCNINHGS